MDINIDQWLDVITNPLGLAGFVLFLSFSLLSFMVREKAEYKKFVPIFWVLAILTLVGAMGLAYFRELKSEREASIYHINQITEGEDGPTVAGVRGDVTINIDKPDDTESLSKHDLPGKDEEHHAGKKATPTTPDSSSKSGWQINQTTKGDGSPAVAGVEGDVKINISPREKH